MKRWQLILPTALIGISLMASSLLPLYAQEEGQAADDQTSEHSAVSVDQPRKIIHLFSKDFPPGAADVTSPASETRFWQALDKAMKENGSMALTENLEEADYRVELRCSGIFKCTNLRVDVRTPQRDVLTSFVLHGVTPIPHISVPKLDLVAQNLTTKLDEHFKSLEQGGYGFYKN
jgi:hypothetical protein